MAVVTFALLISHGLMERICSSRKGRERTATSSKCLSHSLHEAFYFRPDVCRDSDLLSCNRQERDLLFVRQKIIQGKEECLIIAS